MPNNIALKTAVYSKKPKTAQYAHIRLLDAAHPQRGVAEEWVKRTYLMAYRARLKSFYPWMLTVTDAFGQLLSVAGFRPAAMGPLFSEHYLDQPVEKLTGTPREKIVEVGNLAPASPGQARAMITMVTCFLHGAGFQQVVFTAVPRLYNAFRRLGLEPTELAPALPERLPEGAENWGTYYQANPRVFCGNIANGHAVLCARHKEPDRFHHQALTLGEQYRSLFYLRQ